MIRALFQMSLLAGALASPMTADDELRALYGFEGLEIYKFDNGIFGLCHGDWDGDGRVDVALVNNARSRVEVLYRLAEGEPDFVDERTLTGEINELRFDGRFRRAPRSVERKVLRLASGDLDADGVDELVWVEEGGWLTIADAEGGPAAANSLRVRVDALAEGLHLLRVLDHDGDGSADVLAVADGELLLLHTGGELLPSARTLDHVGEGVHDIAVLDLDEDGRDDLLYVYSELDYPVRFRSRRPDGSLGPRTDVDLPQVRSAIAGRWSDGGPLQLAAVFRRSGRLALFEVASSEENQLLRYPLGELSSSDRPRTYAVGDLNGDGRDDVVVAESDASRIRLLTGSETGHLTESEHPSLVGVTHPRVGDVDGDGRGELVVLSAEERVIGTSRVDASGSIGFPAVLATDAEPAALDVADVNGDGFADAVVAVSTGEGRRREYSLQTWLGSSEGLSLARDAALELEKVPSALRLLPIDRDERPDLILFFPGSTPPKLMLQQEDGTFVADPRGEDAPGMGILEDAGPGQVAWGDADGDGAPELLVAARNFARAMILHTESGEHFVPEVLHQWNGPTTDASVRAIALVDWDGPRSEVVLRDERTRELLVLDPETDEVRRRIDAGRMNFQRMEPADLDGDGIEELLVLGDSQVGVLSRGHQGLSLREIASFAPFRERVYYDRLLAADMGGDRRLEIVSTELWENGLTIFSTEGEGVTEALAFRVFEEKTFGSGSNVREPRELGSADFTGDGKADLALLVHDKLILYAQD